MSADLESTVDVVIAGGGLAGLTLAIQLKQANRELDVIVVERTSRPLPIACHKVGESSVELGSHYFGETLGLKSFLEREHLLKNGLRFFAGDSQLPIEARTEIGPSEFPIAPSYQLDRGKFETELREKAVSVGVQLQEGVTVSDVSLGSPHRVSLGDSSTLTCRWFVDATGRRRLLQRKLNLSRPSTVASSAAWFRIERKLRVRELVADGESAWHSRDIDDNRWLSTIHLCGKGYWAWIIPLSTGHTSLGIVADSEHHPFSEFSNEPAARAFLDAHEPALAAAIRGVEFADFRVMRNYAYSSSQVFSEDRWSCVGEAGLFVDPLYSLGSDFLAISNSFTAELIKQDLAGGLEATRVAELNRLYLALAKNAEHMLRNNGTIFLHPEVFGAKLWWDFFFYWSYMCQYFVADCFTGTTEELKKAHDMGDAYFALNRNAQSLLEAWAERRGSTPSPGRPFIPLPMFPSVLADAHTELQTKRTPAEALEKMAIDLVLGKELVGEIAVRAFRDLGKRESVELAAKLGMNAWGLPVGDERVAVDELSGSARRRALSRVTRDLERALGPSNRKEALSELIAPLFTA